MTDSSPRVELLSSEFEIEDDIERITDEYLQKGDLGKRAPSIYAQLGSCLSLLVHAASCFWGCRGGDHTKENLLRRYCNYTLACLRLARLGLYDEALAQMRNLGELANLIELFAVNNKALHEWNTLPGGERWMRFRPKSVRQLITATGNMPIVDEATYGKLCELGVHCTPDSVKTSHQFEGAVHVGGQFSVPALLLVLNELAVVVSRTAIIARFFLDALDPKASSLLEREARQLEGFATEWLRVTNYGERLRQTDTIE